jgi:hypothetical protein
MRKEEGECCERCHMFALNEKVNNKSHETALETGLKLDFERHVFPLILSEMNLDGIELVLMPISLNFYVAPSFSILISNLNRYLIY